MTTMVFHKYYCAGNFSEMCIVEINKKSPGCWMDSTSNNLVFKKYKDNILPPIRYPISTVLECIVKSQKLARASKMKYTHITVDAEVAAKFYHIIWNNPVKFNDILIHPGDFHGMMEFFSIIGKIIQGSSFEDIVYQAGFCINGVLTGKHHNCS